MGQRCPHNFHLLLWTSVLTYTYSILDVHFQFSPLQKTDLDITLHSPYVLVPENGVYSDRARLIVVSLGKVVVKTLDDKASYLVLAFSECAPR